MQSYIHKLPRAAMLAAICTVLTLAVRIPSPLGGYLNLGDCGVLLSAWWLGPAWGAAAAGIGSAFADLLGYPLYAPATLGIKALMAAVSAWALRAMQHHGSSSPAAYCAAGLAGETVMVLGYFFFEGTVLGLGLAAAANIPFNMLQGALGILCAVWMVRQRSFIKSLR